MVKNNKIIVVYVVWDWLFEEVVAVFDSEDKATSFCESQHSYNFDRFEVK